MEYSRSSRANSDHQYRNVGVLRRAAHAVRGAFSPEEKITRRPPDVPDRYQRTSSFRGGQIAPLRDLIVAATAQKNYDD